MKTTSITCSHIALSKTIALATKAKLMLSQKKDVVNLTAGEPDFASPPNVREYVKENIDNFKIAYTNVQGIQELRDAIVEKLLKDNELTYSADQIIVSNGAKHSLFNAMLSILNPGDEVVIFSPYWVSYVEQVRLLSAVPIIVETKFENGFLPTKDDLQKSLTDRTKLILLNSPNNPTGVLYTEETLKMIGETALQNDLYILTDEIYEKLTYGKKHLSILNVMPELRDRTFLINGVSKAYAMTGWRIGYMAAPDDLIEIVAKAQSHTTSNANTLAQYAACEAIKNSKDYTEFMRSKFAERREYVGKRLQNIGMEFVYPDGAFYFFFKSPKGTGEEFCIDILDRSGVVLVPGNAFGMPDFVRMTYAASLDTLEKGLDRIEKYLNQ